MLETVLGHPKGEGHATKLTFLSLLIASKHSAFPPTVSAHEVPAILKKFVSKEATSESAILKLPWQPGRVTFMWRHSVRLGISGKEKNLHLTTQGQQNLFFQAIIHFTIFNAKISEFGTCLTQNNMAQGQPQPRVVVKRFVGSHLDKISWMAWRHQNAAWLLSTVQNGANDVSNFGLL